MEGQPISCSLTATDISKEFCWSVKPPISDADGGWRQIETLPSDAYATGQSLYALAKAGMSAGDPAYAKGVAFLLKTQAANGSWRVTRRSPKFQAYFNSGFPYAGDQWISAWATGWATMALAQAAPATVPRTIR